MNRLRSFIFILLITGTTVSCKTTPNEIKDDTVYEEFVFGIRLVEEPDMVERYLDFHRNIWPEVENGFQIAGYHNIRLYHSDNYVTMIINVPKGSDMGKMGQISNDSHPRVKEWNDLMSTFQIGLSGSKDQSWTQMEKIYEFQSDRLN
jgi:L-rhamnose mutarotase